MKRIEVHYYAMLREARGCSTERVETQAQTAAQLYEELQGRHGIRFPQKKLKVAINHEMSDWQDELNNDDVVTFIPPTAGG